MYQQGFLLRRSSSCIQAGGLNTLLIKKVLFTMRSTLHQSLEYANSLASVSWSTLSSSDVPASTHVHWLTIGFSRTRIEKGFLLQLLSFCLAVRVSKQSNLWQKRLMLLFFSSTPKKTGGIAIPANTTGYPISSSTHSDTVRSYGLSPKSYKAFGHY